MNNIMYVVQAEVQFYLYWLHKKYTFFWKREKICSKYYMTENYNLIVYVRHFTIQINN